MTQEYEPALGASLSLLEPFGVSSTAAKTVILLIVILVATYFLIRRRYPCRSPSSLLQVVERAKSIFNECHSSSAFKDGEYDEFYRLLHQITSRASEISARTRPNDQPGSSSIRKYLTEARFLWIQLRDIVRCHREAQILVRKLEMCIMRASHSRANFQLQDRRATVAPAFENPVDALV
ncbi:hypothetical protein L218DRAFT_1006828 [Marasmius fiardii PR-910]|nr:hypothetical protein L218DRAFT_1006828 [Marasmius fiardii PR-910]